MIRINLKRLAMGAAGLALVAGCTTASAHGSHGQPSTSTAAPAPVDTTSMPGMTMPAQTATAPAQSSTSTAPPAAVPPGTVTVTGSPVKNLIEAAEAAEKSDYCAASKLPPGEGLANKGGTCVSTPLGEIAVHPVRVAASTNNFFNRSGKAIKVKILVADNRGPIDLNAFTHDANNKAGVTLHEFPGQLDANGRPFIHCHLGIAKLVNGFPGELYDGAFSGVQGFKGKGIVATVTGLPRGSYRGDVYCSVPGHAPLPTALANQVQAFDTFDFQVIGRR
jgi:hypothetical protein